MTNPKEPGMSGTTMFTIEDIESSVMTVILDHDGDVRITCCEEVDPDRIAWLLATIADGYRSAEVSDSGSGDVLDL